MHGTSTTSTLQAKILSENYQIDNLLQKNNHIRSSLICVQFAFVLVTYFQYTTFAMIKALLFLKK